jgi:hypothetical protein
MMTVVVEGAGSPRCRKGWSRSGGRIGILLGGCRGVGMRWSGMGGGLGRGWSGVL